MLLVGDSLELSETGFDDHSLLDLLSVVPPSGTAEPRAVTNARLLYKTCVDEAAIEVDGVDTIMTLIDSELGGWPVLKGSSWNATTFDLPNLLVKLRKYSYNFIYRVDTATDEKNSTSYDIEVSRTPTFSDH